MTMCLSVCIYYVCVCAHCTNIHFSNNKLMGLLRGVYSYGYKTRNIYFLNGTYIHTHEEEYVCTHI